MNGEDLLGSVGLTHWACGVWEIDVAGSLGLNVLVGTSHKMQADR